MGTQRARIWTWVTVRFLRKGENVPMMVVIQIHDARWGISDITLESSQCHHPLRWSAQHWYQGSHLASWSMVICGPFHLFVRLDLFMLSTPSLTIDPFRFFHSFTLAHGSKLLSCTLILLDIIPYLTKTLSLPSLHKMTTPTS